MFDHVDMVTTDTPLPALPTDLATFGGPGKAGLAAQHGVTDEGGPPPRDLETRTVAALDQIGRRWAGWIGTGSAAGGHLRPMCTYPMLQQGTAGSLLIITPPGSPTGRNFATTRNVSIGFGTPEDVVMVEGEAYPVREYQLSEDRVTSYKRVKGWDPDEMPELHAAWEVVIRDVRVWNSMLEMDGRVVARRFRWKLPHWRSLIPLGTPS